MTLVNYGSLEGLAFFTCGRSQGKNKGLGIEPTAGSGGKNSLSAPVVALIKGQISF